MSSVHSKLHKPKTSRQEIVLALRSRILRGEIPPGGVFPRRIDLERQFGASPLTVQRAIDALRQEGFIYVKGRRGTFVSPRPPHLCQYAVVFCLPGPHGESGLPRFYQAIANEAFAVDRGGERRMDVRFGVQAHADNEKYRTLVAGMHAHLYAGMIFATHPYHDLAGTPLVEEPGIPRVAIMEPMEGQAMAAVALDSQSFIDKALDYLASRGRRRVAVLSAARVSDFFERVVQGMQARQIATRPYWLLQVHIDRAACARSCIHLLLNDKQIERPDGLIIADDNLVEDASAGIVAAGVRVPEDLEVVAHCNFPWPTSSVLPLRRLGYDARTVLSACIDSIDQQRRGEAASNRTISAAFEDEVAIAVSPASRSLITGGNG